MVGIALAAIETLKPWWMSKVRCGSLQVMEWEAEGSGVVTDAGAG